MAVDIYIFDCDGTIINSGEDIADCVNIALKQFGYWQIDPKKIISFVGDGARNLILRSLKESTKNKFDETTKYNSTQLKNVLDYYIEYYNANPVNKTYVYAGIRELLKVLHKKNKKICLLTNKPESTVRLIFEHFDIEKYFDLIVAPDTLRDDGSKIKMKPDPDGLSYCVEKINQKFNLSCTNKNAIMIGDSEQDIMAGKAFGCKTVACRSGMGDKEKLLACESDLCFSVASEIEKFIDILSDDEKESNIKNYAMQNEVPIMQDEASDFICEYIKVHNLKKILEIGTAIGYSTIKFAMVNDDINVTTIEIDEKRFNDAKQNFKNSGVDNRITAIFGDALEVELQEKFDLIFIDAAKAQYIKFFEKFKNNLSQNGVFISDNLSFHGMVEDLSLTHNYSTKKLVKKIRKYIDFLKTNQEFESEFLKLGDGIAVSRRI